jgi:hypothetical protein
MLMGFVVSKEQHVCLGRLIYLLSAVSAVYRNRIVLNNIDKLQNNVFLPVMFFIDVFPHHIQDGGTNETEKKD